MLIFSTGMIKVDKRGEVRLWGVLKPHQAEVADFMRDLDLRGVTIKYREGRILFSKNVDKSHQQRIRNFLVNLPALRRLR